MQSKTRPNLKLVTQQTPGALPVGSALIFATAVLLVIGIAMVFSASTARALDEGLPTMSYMWKQMTGVVAGLFGAAIGYNANPKLLRRLTRLALPAVTGLLVAVLFFDAAGGAHRWIELSGIKFQPSEAAKLILILWVAKVLADTSKDISDAKANILPIGVVTVIMCGLIIREPDLSTALLIVAVVGIMLVVAGTRLDVLAICALVSSLPIYLLLFNGYRGARWVSLDPWNDPSGDGYQSVQSMLGIHSGGWFGVGPGGSKTKWGYLPAAHTDSIFAVVGEELGLIGCLIVISMFALIVAAGIYLALKARTRFDRMVAVGISSWIGLQATLNIGVVTGAFPNTGVTLPFVSYGVTSMMMTLSAMGLLLGIAKRAT